MMLQGKIASSPAPRAADAKVMEKTGRVFSSWDLSDEYGFTDADGSPNI